MSKTLTTSDEIDRELASCSSSDLERFYRSYLASSKPNVLLAFFGSKSVIAYARFFFKGPYGADLILKYFGQSVATNPTLLKWLVREAFDLLQIGIKAQRAHLNDRHLSSLKSLNVPGYTPLKQLLKELELLRKMHHLWDKSRDFYDDILNQYPIERIFIELIAYVERQKRSNRDFLNNRSFVDAFITNILSSLEAYFQRRKAGLALEYILSVEKLSSDFQQAEPPANSAINLVRNQAEPETISAEVRLMRECFEFWLKLRSYDYHLDCYGAGLIDIDNIERDTSTIHFITNREYSRFKRNDFKNRLESAYYLMKKLGAIGHTDKLNGLLSLETHIEQVVDYFKSSSVMEGLEANNETEFYSDILRFLYTLSSLSKPLGKTFIPNQYKPDDFSTHYLEIFQEGKKFENVFGRGYILCWRDEDFIERCSQFFGWTSDYSWRVVTFVSASITEDNFKSLNLMQTPLILSQGHFIWLSSLLERKWENELIDRVTNFKKFHGTRQSSQREQRIAKALHNSGINAIAGFQFDSGMNDGIKGDMDVVAYDGKRLLVIELKITHPSEDIGRIWKYKLQRLDTKAFEQLEKARQFLSSNWVQFVKSTNWDLPMDPQNLSIDYMVVTNTFDYDDFGIKRVYRKISEFELLVILGNDLYNMWNVKLNGTRVSLDILLNIGDNWSDTYRKEVEKINLDDLEPLWTDLSKCSVEDILRAIDQDSIWAPMDISRRFSFGGLSSITVPDNQTSIF